MTGTRRIPRGIEAEHNLKNYGGIHINPRRVKKINDHLLRNYGGYWTAKLTGEQASISRLAQETLEATTYRGAPTLETIEAYVNMVKEMATLGMIDVHQYEDKGALYWAIAHMDYFKGVK